jgi:hypothetical protein
LERQEERVRQKEFQVKTALIAKQVRVLFITREATEIVAQEIDVSQDTPFLLN